MSRGEEIFSLSSVSLGNGGAFDRRLRGSRTGKPFLSFPFGCVATTEEEEEERKRPLFVLLFPSRLRLLYVRGTDGGRR